MLLVHAEDSKWVVSSVFQHPQHGHSTVCVSAKINPGKKNFKLALEIGMSDLPEDEVVAAEYLLVLCTAILKAKSVAVNKLNEDMAFNLFTGTEDDDQLTDYQADKVTSALKEAFDEMYPERRMRKNREIVQKFSDGVMTADGIVIASRK